MATLIRKKVEGKKVQICNARCYHSKRVLCRCICGGMNHQKGLEQATINTKEKQSELEAQGLVVKLPKEG